MLLYAGYESQKSKAFLNHQKLSYPKGVIESWLSENFFLVHGKSITKSLE